MVCIHNGILFSHKKGGYLAICDNMDRPQAHYVKWDKSEKDKYCRISFMGSKKTKVKW